MIRSCLAALCVFETLWQKPIRYSLAVLCAFVSLWLNSSAQTTFRKTYGDSTVNDNGQSILQASDGGFLIAGTRFNSGNQIESLFLIRTDQVGDTLWTKLIREPLISYSGSQVIQAADNGFAITGIKGGGITFVPYLLRVDSAGNILWNKSYLWFADEHINSIVQTPDSGFLLAGYRYDGANNQVYFIRTDSSGDTLWTKSYKENFYNASVYSVRLTSDHGFIAAGSIQDANTQDVDAFLLKTDSVGNFLWAKGYGESGYDYAQQVETTSDSGFAIAAVTYSFGAGLADFFLIKTDSLGDLQWSETYGGASDDRSESVRQMPDGGYLFTGESASFSSGNFEVYCIRTSAIGDTAWTKAINAVVNNEGYSSAITTDGFAITGTYLNQFGNNDVLLWRADSAGNSGCTEQSTGTQTNGPLTQVNNHHFSISSTSPTVIGHQLDSTSGTGVQLICINDGLNEATGKDRLVVFPNPVTGRMASVNFRFNEPVQPIKEVAVYNFQGGKIIMEADGQTAGENITIDTRLLSAGIYILEARFSTYVVRTRFIKQ